MKMYFLVVVLYALSNITAYAEYPLAAEIVSKDLTITNATQFKQKLTSLITQAKSILLKAVTPASKKEADRLYTRLSTFLEVYEDRYKTNQNLEAKDLLHDVSMKFALQSPIPWTLPMVDVFITPSFKTGTFEDIFTFALADKQKPLTQTEAYLSRPEFRPFMTRGNYLCSFGDNGAKARMALEGAFNPIIEKVIQQERDLRDYYVFYHSQKRDFFLIAEFIKEVLRRMSGKEQSAEFDYLRTPGSEEYNKKLSDVLKQGFDTDHEAAIRNILLSVNLSLFNNAENSGSEQSFCYFILNKSILDIRIAWKAVLESLNLNPSEHTIDDLTRILPPREYWDLAEGSLLQIFIPKNKVNDYVFLSKVFGKPLNEPIGFDYGGLAEYPLRAITFKDKNGVTHTYDPKTIDTATYLNIYRNYPKAIDPKDMDNIQARILLTNDFLLNPRSGVKIYRYNTFTPEEVAAYKQKLKEIVDRILHEKVSSESRAKKATL